MAPRNLFSLPPSFLAGSSVAQQSSTAPTDELSQGLQGVTIASSSPVQDNSSRQEATQSPGFREAGATCQACGIGYGSAGFASAAEQRAHFKTDWHRYNVKRKLARQPPISEDQFLALIDNSDSEVSSISGSSSEESSDEGEGDTHTGKRAGRNRGAAAAAPRVTFRAADGQLFCVWRCLVERDHVRGHTEPLTPAQHLTELQRLRGGGSVFVVLLLRGGHVAAAVFRARGVPDRTPAIPSTSQQGVTQSTATSSTAAAVSTPSAPPKANHAQDVFEVVAHKTFHRYVVRAKAGGRQSAKDATGKYARSAGAALRRYNEAALDRDVSELLSTWRTHLDAASLIFVQAPAANARSVFADATAAAAAALDDNSRATSLVAAGAGSAAALLNPSDPRIRRIPFVTHRPTFTEARRVIGLLLAVFEPSAEALAAQQAAEEAAVAGEERKAQKRLLRKQKKAQQASVSAGVAGVQGGGGVGGGVQGEGAGDAGQGTGQQAAAAQQIQETPLHAAARQGDTRLIAQLLAEGANPCARDSRGRTAYAVAVDKDTRDAFRRRMAAAPDEWDWAAAGVPSPLTDELQEAQAAKKAEKRARQKAKEKERKAQTEEQREAAAKAAKAAMLDEVAQAAAEAAALAAKLNTGPAGGKGRGGAAGSGNKQVGGRGGGRVAAPQASAPLTPEELARRREMMAQAAEARAKALQQATQSQRLY